MRSYLFCAWPRFMWLRHDAGARTPLPGAEALLRYDAFESIMWTLRRRLHGGLGWPADWNQGCKAVRDYFEHPPAGVREWRPWANFDLDQTILANLGVNLSSHGRPHASL